MKNLKNYIKYSLNESVWDINESVWDIEDNVESNNKEFILANVKRFIDNNYLNNMSRHCEYIFQPFQADRERQDRRRSVFWLRNGQAPDTFRRFH